MISRRRTPAPNSKTVALVATPGVQLLDVSGPLDVFAEANAQTGCGVYRLLLVATQPGALRSSAGVRLVPDQVVGQPMEQEIHTLLIAGSPKAADTRLPASVLEWICVHARRAKRFGSVCSGAFFLAQGGLIDGRRVTTHWAVARQLAQKYPRVTVDEGALYVRDGRIRTAAGVTAGLDLALALVEEDLGREVALRVSNQLVMFFKRPGGQMQFSQRGQAELGGRSALQEVQRYVIAHPAEEHGIAELAGRAGLSPRHFARLFRHEVGDTPARWVEAARITAARGLLETGRSAPKEVAAQCGFANADTLRRAFARHLGVSPAQYRKLHPQT